MRVEQSKQCGDSKWWCSGVFLVAFFFFGNCLKSWAFVCMWAPHHARGSFCSWNGIRVTILVYRAQVNNLFFWWLSSLGAVDVASRCLFPSLLFPILARGGSTCARSVRACLSMLCPGTLFLQCQVSPRCWDVFLFCARQHFKLGLRRLTKPFRNDSAAEG